MAAPSAAALAEFAKRLSSYRDDPVGFCEEVLGFSPHEGQREWLLNANATENALTTGNRWGKSWIAGANLIYRSAYKKGWTRETADRMRDTHGAYHTINVSITADQARLVWDKADAMLRGPKASWLVAKQVTSPFPRITLINGAIIEARSTDNDGRRLLGNSYDFVNWDEAAYETKFIHVRDNVLRMRLADRAGRLDYTSTGNGRNDFGRYFLTGLPGEKKDPDLYSQSGSSRDNPFIDQGRIAKNAERMSEKMRRQNIDGAIVDAGTDFFDQADLLSAISEDLTGIARVKFDDDDQECHVYLMPENIPWKARYPSHRYMHAWDLADKQDFTVGYTFDTSVTPAKVVEFERFHKLGWDHVYARIRDRHHRYGTPKGTKIDSTGLGDVVENELKDIHAEGLNFAGKKDAMLQNLQTRLAGRDFVMPFIKVVLDEMTFYERDDAKLIQDCVMALGVGAWFLSRPRGQVFAEMI